MQNQSAFEGETLQGLTAALEAIKDTYPPSWLINSSSHLVSLSKNTGKSDFLQGGIPGQMIGSLS